LAYLACRGITSSKLGRVLLALRDAESRVRFLGYSVTNAKLFVFTMAAMLAGLAGALYVPQVGIINPGEFSPANSIEVAIWVSVGGRGTLVGAVIGAILVNLAKSWLTAAAPDTWLFFLGGLFVLTTLVFSKGVVGIFQRVRWTRPPAAVALPAAEEA
ncbi:MAG: ABC transporter permease subunit, partial [Stellaceae bacterium]